MTSSPVSACHQVCLLQRCSSGNISPATAEVPCPCFQGGLLAGLLSYETWYASFTPSVKGIDIGLRHTVRFLIFFKGAPIFN